MTDKIKFNIEYPIHASSNFLHHYLASPDGLSEWFADNVNSRGEIFSFFWDGSEEKATQKLFSKEEKVRYLWEDEDEGYFEFKIQIDDLTNDLSLIITDFAEEDEVEEQKMFWDNQINTLKRTIGA